VDVLRPLRLRRAGPTTRVCAACWLEKGKAQFATATSTVCRDCE
jgi:hypothetical protein